MAMALFDVDTANRLFIEKAGVGDSTIDLRVDFYSDAKEHWIVDDDANGHDFPMRVVGGDDIVAGTSAIPMYAFLKGGWRIRPAERDHTLNILSGILLVDGGGDPFVDTLGAYTVRVNYQQPVQSIESTLAGPDGFITALNESTYDGVEWQDVVQFLLAMANGRMVQTGSDPNVFEIYKQDNITVLYTLTQSDTERTRS
jgi:hypothetical protein